MYAYRFEKDKKIVQGQDSDGETGAGPKLLQMLEAVDAVNIFTMVVRFYGGVKIGNSRFRVITDTALELLRAELLIRKKIIKKTTIN